MSTDPCRYRRARLGVAGALVAMALPLVTGTPGAAHAAEDEPAYGAYATSASATPIRVEIYEPALPLPVDAGLPELEFNMGYSKVRADSGQSEGRASLFWPGDPVGEGLKTFGEQLGLPSTPLTANGYPVQVNAKYPSDETSQTDNMVPGSIQHAEAGEGTAIGETGFTPDGVLIGPPVDDTEGGAAPAPANPVTDLINKITGLFSGAAKGGDAPVPGLPTGLEALIDVDGYTSVSKMRAKKSPVVGTSRSVLGEVRLLGGLITFGGIEAVARVTSDGVTGQASGKATWGGMSIAGQKFSIGPDGIEATGKTLPIPGLDQIPLNLLENLGILIEVPPASNTVEGDVATSVVEGLRITIDTFVLAPVIKTLPMGILAELIPAEAGPVKSVVSGLSTLSPKIVITLGQAKATVDTVEPFADIPVDESPAPSDEAAPPAPEANAAPAPVVADAPPPTGPAPIAAAPATSAPVGDLVDAAPTSAGLPDLFSIPGALLIGAMLLAAVAGTWFRRIGVAALGSGAPCTHGLDIGLPDLRKA